MKSTINTTTAKTVKTAFVKAGYTAAIEGNTFAYQYKSRAYWFTICQDGVLLFDHCYSAETKKVSRDIPTRDAAYNRIELVSGLAALELTTGVIGAIHGTINKSRENRVNI